MKRLIFLIFFFLILTNIFSQNEIATICDSYYLKISLDEFRKVNKIEIKNNNANFKIVKYTLHVIGKGGIIQELTCNSDSLTEKIKNEIKPEMSGKRFYIHNIVAVNNKNDSLLLNPIEIHLGGGYKCDSKERNYLTVKPTIANKFDGIITKSELIKTNEIELLNNPDSLKIKKVEWFAYANIRLSVFPPLENTNKFSNTMKWLFKESKKIQYLYLYEIIVVDKLNSEYELPAIIFTSEK